MQSFVAFCCGVLLWRFVVEFACIITNSIFSLSLSLSRSLSFSLSRGSWGVRGRDRHPSPSADEERVTLSPPLIFN